ncbi:MAG TPA: glutaminyl-peptide cyclotransferase [Xanthobacteraceae bacterium]|nr:glutaminyl-peptide cyclotransferase [Xanthobacteraceae bacterium]
MTHAKHQGQRNRSSVVHAAVIAALVTMIAAGQSNALAQSCAQPTPMRFEIVNKIVRSQLGFTQGLEFRDGQMYESTGLVNGTTQLNTISPTGQVKTLVDRGTTVFGEGLTILNDEVFQLTWQNHDVFVYDLDGKFKRRMRNPRDGWGLTNDGTRLIFSDGGESIYYADPRSFGITRIVRIKSNQPGPVLGLNELEWVKGKIYGNIFTTRFIVRLDPSSGCIEGTAELSGLWNAMTADERASTDGNENVLNGIAYEPKSDLFYLTGKRWKTIFATKLVEGR